MRSTPGGRTAPAQTGSNGPPSADRRTVSSQVDSGSMTRTIRLSRRRAPRASPKGPRTASHAGTASGSGAYRPSSRRAYSVPACPAKASACVSSYGANRPVSRFSAVVSPTPARSPER